jgi:hypothetical protein
MDETFDFGLVSYPTLDGRTANVASEHLDEPDVHLHFLVFLGLAQHLGIDFIPVTWHTVLETARRGGTAEIQQMAIDVQNSYAFKRLSSERFEQRVRDLAALTTELAVLCHPAVRNHPYISQLDSICWDILPATEEVWPVLVFEKAPHGDLKAFMERGPGKALNFAERLSICANITIAILDMHKNCMTT